MGIKSWGIFLLMSLSYEFRVQVSSLGSNIELLQWNPGNSNFEGKRKTVRVSGVSSYRGRLKYSIFQVNN